MARIVSLLPSSTEIVAALGLDRHLVGRSHECDFPASVKDLPAHTAPKFDPDGRSYQIKERVKAILQESVSVYRINAELLNDLKPTHIITQTQCEVCAVSFDEVERVACDFLDTPAEIIALAPNALSDVFDDIQKVATALDVSERGEQLVKEMRTKMNNVDQLAREIKDQPTVACIEWINPLMAGGNWLPTLVEMAGGLNLFGRAGAHSPWLSWEVLRSADPDIIVLLPCGYDMEKTAIEAEDLPYNDGWEDLRAVKNGRVYITDGNQFFNRPGPRLVESQEILAEIFHPNRFSFGHEGTGWRKLTS